MKELRLSLVPRGLIEKHTIKARDTGYNISGDSVYALVIKSKDDWSMPSKDLETTRRLCRSLSIKYVYHN